MSSTPWNGESRNDPGLPRRLVASSRRGRPGERLDLVVHALAQLPDGVSAELEVTRAQGVSLERLAAAYDLGDRLGVSTGNDPDGATVVYPSRENLATAPLRSSGAPSWLFDEASGSPGAAHHAVSMAELLEGLSETDDPPASCRGADGFLYGERLAIVTNVPTHYRVPLWNALDRRLRAAGAELRVFFSATGSGGRSGWLRHQSIECDHVFLSARHLGIGADAPLDLERRLRAWKPTMVVSGGFAPAVSGRIARFTSRAGMPFGIWSGDIDGEPTTRGRLRRRQREWILRRADFGIVYGSRALEYLRHMAPKLPSVIVRNTAPVTELGGDRNGGVVELLAVGQAIRRKRLDVVIDALGMLHELPCRLTVAGGGPELPALKARAGGRANVRFLGAVPSDRILELYREADIFLFPSGSDVFGLVLVEALGGGLATVTSSSPGCVADLAVNGSTAIVLDKHHPWQWAGAIRGLVEDRDLRQTLATNGRRTLENRWTMDHSVDAWVAGFRLGALQRQADGLGGRSER